MNALLHKFRTAAVSLALGAAAFAQTPVLSVVNLSEGMTAQVSVASCAPGDLVLVAYSFSGGGPMSGPFGVVELSPPLALFPLLAADGAGVAAIQVPVPFGVAAVPVWIQAVNLSTAKMSAGVATSIAPNTTDAYLLPIPGGSFSMGDNFGVGFPHELPAHLVSLDSFAMDQFEVDIEHYLDFLNSSFSAGELAVSGSTAIQVGGAGAAICDTWSSTSFTKVTFDGATFGVILGYQEHPMVQVTWHGACLFANWRSAQDGLGECYDTTTFDCDFSASGYRLPTEAEWEYAARGGAAVASQFAWGNSINGSNANFKDSGDAFDNGTTPVGYYDGGQLPAGGDMRNAYGLYDMAGNVWEWCGDLYDSNYYAVSPSSNPTGPATPIGSTDRILRGGRWHGAGAACRSANRYHGVPTNRISTFGFRLVRR